MEGGESEVGDLYAPGSELKIACPREGSPFDGGVPEWIGFFPKGEVDPIFSPWVYLLSEFWSGSGGAEVLEHFNVCFHMGVE